MGGVGVGVQWRGDGGCLGPSLRQRDHSRYFALVSRENDLLWRKTIFSSKITQYLISKKSPLYKDTYLPKTSSSINL